MSVVKELPLETNVDGIFLCGGATGPIDISDSVSQASAAAMKAILWSNNIYYVGSKGDGARIYYRFVPNKFEVKILAYSNKAKQTSITKRMERLYDN